MDNRHIFLRYYGINVFSFPSARQKLYSNKSLARLIIFLGLCLLLITAIDISELSGTLTKTEQSIWPSSGKGIWIGLFLMCIGVFTLIAVKEESYSAFSIVLPYVIVGIVLCLFGLLTSISVLERYRKDPDLSNQQNRNKEESIQFALSGLLIGIFTLSVLFLSCLSCLMCWTIPKHSSKYQNFNSEQYSSSISQHSFLRRPMIVGSPHIRYPPPYSTNRAYQMS